MAKTQTIVAWFKRTEIEWFVSFKVSLAVAIGTLLSLTPAYSALFNSGFSLADQVIFTVLGGANLTVGDCTEQLFWRYGVGASVGAATYAILSLCGSAPVAQGQSSASDAANGSGFLFAILVFAITLFRRRVFAADIGLTFATLAAVYAVDASYRNGSHASVDGDALHDLMLAWAFGALISVAVNFLVLPVKASGLLQKRIVESLQRIRHITLWTFAGDESRAFTADSLDRTLHEDGVLLNDLLAQTEWEFGYGATLEHRRAVVDAIVTVQRQLALAARDGPFVRDLPAQLAAIVRPAAESAARYSNSALLRISDMHGRRKRNDLEKPDASATLFSARIALDKAVALATDRMIASPDADSTALFALDRAMHALGGTEQLLAAVNALEQLCSSNEPRSVRFYVFRTISRQLASLPSRIKPRPRAWIASISADDLKWTAKVTAALSCLLSILWSDASRAFWQQYGVRNATVPLLLALMPNTGLSVLSWIGQLTGAAVGAMNGALILVMWRGIGRQAYCVPGIFFIQLILNMASAWRLATGPDFFAVTALNGCGIFLNVQWQFSRLPDEQSLALHLGYALVATSIAIAFAVPWQLIVFPSSARKAFRQGTAAVLYRLSALALSEVELSSLVLHTDDAAAIKSKAAQLQAELRSIQADIHGQAGLVDFAAREYHQLDGFNASQARSLVNALRRYSYPVADHLALCAAGPLDERIRSRLTDGSSAARAFAETSSATLWTLGASYSLGRTPPIAPSSLHCAADRLLKAVQLPFDGGLETLEERSELRRFWALSLTLATQARAFDTVVAIMRPESPTDAVTPGLEEKVGLLALPTL